MRRVSAKRKPQLSGGLRTDGSWSDHAGICWDHGRIILGSFSDRLRAVNDVSVVFKKFLSYFGVSFFAAGMVTLEGDSCCSAQCKVMTFHVLRR